MPKSFGEAHPNEFAADPGYGLQFSDSYPMAVALHYIRADNNLATGERSVGNAFVADTSGFYDRYFDLGSVKSSRTFGLNAKSISTKISYNNGGTSAFIPTNLPLGMGLLYPFDEYNTLVASMEASKLLVSTLPVKDQTNPEAYDAVRQKYLSTSSIAGISISLADVPGGFKEEV